MIHNVTEEVRNDVIDHLKDMRVGQPEAFQFVYDDIIKRMRKLPIARVYEKAVKE